MTFGTFDSFHPGHEYYLRQARKYWDYIITVIARDATVMKVKGRLPKNNEIIRLQTVINAELSDETHLGSLIDPYKYIMQKKPDVLCFWYDQNSFNNENLYTFLRENHLDPKIIRLPAFQPEKWKSSLLPE